MLKRTFFEQILLAVACSAPSRHGDHEILNKNKINIKGIWDILNSIIKNGSRQCYPQYFIDNDIRKENMDDIVNSFNQFFVSVGPNLAEKIPDLPSSQDWNDNVIDRNTNSVFVTAVEENKLIDIVNKCKDKTSTDGNNINMKIVKKVIEGILKPLTFICNLSFQTGKFPSKMKIAKVVPHNLEIDTNSQITDPSHYYRNFQKF